MENHECDEMWKVRPLDQLGIIWLEGESDMDLEKHICPDSVF